MLYLVDSCCLITPSRKYAPIDVALSFWNIIEALFSRDDIRSIDKVNKEIAVGADRLKVWCDTRIKDSAFLNTDREDVIVNYAELMNWATDKGNGYKPEAQRKFLDDDRADAWLVAYAMLDKENTTVVTEELSAPLKTAEIKLPNACRAHGIKSISLIDMMRELGITY